MIKFIGKAQNAADVGGQYRPSLCLGLICNEAWDILKDVAHSYSSPAYHIVKESTFQRLHEIGKIKIINITLKSKVIIIGHLRNTLDFVTMFPYSVQRDTQTAKAHSSTLSLVNDHQTIGDVRSTSC